MKNKKTNIDTSIYLREQKKRANNNIRYVGLLLIACIMFSILILSGNAADSSNSTLSNNTITVSPANSSKSNVDLVQVNAKKENEDNNVVKKMKEDPALRKEAAARFKASRDAVLTAGGMLDMPQLDPGGIPHYFGPYPNYANSPLPNGSVASIVLVSGGSNYTSPTIMVQDIYVDVYNVTGLRKAGVTGANATATVTNGVITAITLNNGGNGYTMGSTPTVTIMDTTGSGATATATIGGPTLGGIKKFVDSLPLLGPTGTNNLGQYIPIAVPETVTYSNEPADYYAIGLVEYTEKMHSDLPPTTLRGYVQLSTTAVQGSHIPLKYLNGSSILIGGVQAYAVDNPHFMGPAIIAQKDKPVRIKFYNLLPTGSGGDLFLPVDTTVMGAGHYDINFDPVTKEPLGTNLKGMFTENRATLHLHGGFVPWISDGTPHQWITPAGENTNYPQGVSVYTVPDMPDAGANDGSMTFYYNNDQSARLMFYHDHAFGITRLNVYAGEAAPYLVSDQVEKDMIAGTNVTGVNPTGAQVLPDTGIPLVIQDRTFVDSTTIAAQDPTWKWGTTPPTPNTGDLWYPHVYMPNQNPEDPSGMNAFGRWHYGPWFWPPTTDITYPPIPNPYYDPVNAPWEPSLMPATPNPSEAAEAFMDTPIVNGVAYPYLEVEPKAYRFRILNAADDRFLNLQIYEADPTILTADGRINTEVKMVPAVATTGFPADWPIDGREGGVPDPFTAGPSFIQIGNEGGFLPEPVVIPNQPVDWNMDQTNFDMGVVNKGTVILGSAERADVIIDFSAYRNKTLILYNDAPAPFPAIDPRYDYHTGNPDHTDMGGAPTTQPGYGPNTRTIMQIRVKDVAPSPTYDMAALEAVFAKTNTKGGVFEVSQDQIIVPQANYNSAYNMSFPADPFMRIATQSMSYFDFISGSQLTSLKLTNGGSGYTSPPTVTISAPTSTGGTTATANATLAPRSVASVTVTNGGNTYTSAPTVSFLGGGGTGATATAALSPTGVASITVTNGGKGYTSAPAVSLTGGSGTGAAATAIVQGGQVRSIIVNNAGTGYTFTPTVTITGGGGTGATATAALAPSSVASVTVTSKGSGYTSAPTVSFTGGGGAGAAATAVLGPAAVASLNLINGGSGYTSAPTVTFTGGGGSKAAAVAIGIPIAFEPKAIQDEMGEAFDHDYGRMTAMLGLELPNSAAGVQDFMLIPFLSAPVDIIGAPVGTLGDGIQVWRITHNGVDTHTVHFHLFNAQIINRVAWDNAIRPPDMNEMGWKETFRVNPLQDTFIAFKPVAPTLPFKIPNSIRPLDPTMPLGDPLDAPLGGWKDPAGNPVPAVNNKLVNFGWEYLYHCHLLAHEEFDMMHSVILGVTPDTPLTLGALQSGKGNNQKVTLTWTDNSTDEVSFKIQRATTTTGPWNTIATVPSSTGPGTGSTKTYIDATVQRTTTYYYRIVATNVVGDTTSYPAPSIGFPTVSYDSTPSSTVTATTI